ncbi:Scarecrow-like protein 9 [Dichanthelium oligosanthes]|uniref:Scarecrow-like protein 9 n=1 Tax=Dichanthelium oligosanthes TaxID=888268 RepID=A0A1E5WAY9_9POAL|nr:Scarecrow-like protein 9 [Dichanthelium oligosanthes]
MATTPPELPGQGDPEPFSPSVFLDLPPTPRPPEREGEENPAASSDDLVLPFISRILMEDDISDKVFYQCPDHPALLQVQQPFAQILSDAAACSNSAATNTKGSGTDALSPSSGAPEFANATWPYDPVQLSELLLSTSRPDMRVGLGDTTVTADDVTQLFLPQKEGTTVDSHQNRVTMDILNLAFLRGMGEANKFLPTDNSLLVNLEATSEEHLPWDSNLSHGIAPCQVRKEDEVDGMLLLKGIGNGCGHKNRRNWDDLQAETGRNSKLMVPEPEETGEVVDEIIINDYRLCINEMQGLSITMGSRDEKNIRKGNGKPVQGKHSSDEVVDWRTLLIHCAQAVSMDDRHSAIELLGQIKQHSSPRGDSNQRLAHCFAEGLQARLAGTGSQVYKSLMAKRTSLVEYLKAYQLYLTTCCFKMMAYKFSNMTIAKVSAGRKKVHIVDYGMHHALQWSSLLGWLGTLEDGPPEVRFTGIDLPQPGFRPAALIEETGCRLSKCAHQFGVTFKFRSIMKKWETVCVDDLNIDTDEMRNHRAGLRQLPLDPDIVKVIRKNVKDRYHKDFDIDVDHRWLLEGWKGRILCAMSTWVADDAVSK